MGLQHPLSVLLSVSAGTLVELSRWWLLSIKYALCGQVALIWSLMYTIQLQVECGMAGKTIFGHLVLRSKCCTSGLTCMAQAPQLPVHVICCQLLFKWPARIGSPSSVLFLLFCCRLPDFSEVHSVHVDWPAVLRPPILIAIIKSEIPKFLYYLSFPWKIKNGR